MNKIFPTVAFGLAIAFMGGFFTHFLYQRWNSPGAQVGAAGVAGPASEGIALEPQSHQVTFSPLTPAHPRQSFSRRPFGQKQYLFLEFRPFTRSADWRDICVSRRVIR